MDAQRIDQIAAWLAATDIGLLELHGPGGTLVLRHDGVGVAVVASAEAEPAEPALTPDTLTVGATSPGRFLHRHPLRSEPLAAPGADLQAGQALGLLQVGALLLPVTAPAEGTVLELLAAHEAVVGYGAPLATLQPRTTS